MSDDGRPRRRAGAAVQLGIVGAALGTAGWAAWALTDVVGGSGLVISDIVLVGLFVLLLTWMAFAFWTVIAGFAARVAGWRGDGPAALPAGTPLADRVAILVPVHNEDPAEVFARIEAMWRDLAARPDGARFDLFVLSDSTDPDIWLAEELAWETLCRRTGGGGRIFYRHRRRNVAHKSGNVADFCRRWGGRYESMIVLDADSLMSGETMVALARRMAANPRVGLIQTFPHLVDGDSLLARLCQFASSMYGAAFARGLSLWQRENGNFLGHNAIVRVRAFAASCGLPELRGRRPFGGAILSHDFVEAALLRRAGWEVWMAADLRGSYESFPPTVLDHARRDRRWCQGNLQHLRTLAARGLHPISRMHMVNGVMAYLSAPVWLLFLVVSLLDAALVEIFPPDLFPEAHMLFPSWPRFDEVGALGLLGTVVALLFLPRILAFVETLATPGTARAHGGVLALVAGFVIEIVASTLMAPILMALQSGHVASILSGRDAGWSGQRRSADGLTWGEAARLCRLPVAVGAVLLALGLAAGGAVIYWLTPLVLSFGLSVPIVWLLSRAAAGSALRRAGLLLVPEEVAPPPVVAAWRHLRAEWRGIVGAPRDAIAVLRSDARARRIHEAVLDQTGEAASDPATLAAARAALGAGAPLSVEAKRVVLSDPIEVRALAEETRPAA